MLAKPWYFKFFCLTRLSTCLLSVYHCLPDPCMILRMISAWPVHDPYMISSWYMHNSCIIPALSLHDPYMVPAWSQRDHWNDHCMINACFLHDPCMSIEIIPNDPCMVPAWSMHDPYMITEMITAWFLHDPWMIPAWFLHDHWLTDSVSEIYSSLSGIYIYLIYISIWSLHALFLRPACYSLISYNFLSDLL